MIDRKRLIRPALFSAYFVVAFLVFLVLLFPYDRAKGRIEAEVRRRTSLELAIGDIRPRFINRFAFSDVVLSNRTGRILFESPSLTATTSLFGLARGTFVFDLDAIAYNGELLASARLGKNQRQYELRANNLDLSSYSLFKNAGITLTGRLGGSLDMTGDTGAIKASIKGLASRKLTIKGFPIPDLDFDQCWMEAAIKGDRLTVKKMNLDGKELRLQCNGDMVLAERGGLNLLFKLKPSERLVHEQAALLSLFRNKDAEGFYQFTLGGTLTDPAMRL